MPSLAYLQNQYGTGKALPGFNLPGDPLNTVHGLGGSMGRIGDTITSADGSIGPILNALNASPVCDADMACIAARARLQQSADAKNNPVLPSQTVAPTPTPYPAEVPPATTQTVSPTQTTTTQTVPTAQVIPGKEKPEPTDQNPTPTTSQAPLSPGWERPHHDRRQPADHGNHQPGGSGRPPDPASAGHRHAGAGQPPGRHRCLAAGRPDQTTRGWPRAGLLVPAGDEAGRHHPLDGGLLHSCADPDRR